MNNYPNVDRIDFSNPDLFNHIFIPLFHLPANKRFRILYGGRDSGKSDFVAQWFIPQLLSPKFFRGMLVRKYYASIRQSQFQTILDYLDLWNIRSLFHVKENPLEIICKHNGNNVFARGLDKPDKTLSVKDPTCAWYEEADQIAYESFLQTSNSIRTSRTEELVEWLTFNPRNEKSWVNNHFFPPKQTYENDKGDFDYIKSHRDDTVILHTKYKDNRFCPIPRQRNLESVINIDYNYYKVNVLGLWGGSLKGLVYTDYNVVDEFPNVDFAYGLDYGFNNPSSFVKVGYADGNIYLQEILHNPSYTHTTLSYFVKKHIANSGKSGLVIVDSAEPALITQLRQHGVQATPAAKSSSEIKTVYDGIMLCKQYKINVVKGSENVIKELDSYSWKSDKDGNVFDEPVKIDDHSMDAFRYVIQTYGIRNWRLISHKSMLNSKTRPSRSKDNKFIGY
jgi:phage terminase large subunit